MVKLNVHSVGDDLDEDPPDIFRAARSDDVDELHRAIQRGQAVDEFDRRGDTTPIHLACAHRSKAFLRAAMSYDFNPWIRDRNERLAIDHAVANGLRDTQEALFAKMYEADPTPDNVIPLDKPGLD